MKKILTSLLLLTAYCVSSQVVINEKCGTMPSLEYRLQNDPLTRQLWNNKHIRSAARSTVNYDTTGYVVIPVVFHVVYNPSNPSENIPDSLIFSQIDVLNNDHAFTSATAGTTLPIFDTVAANTGIRFCLATLDPSGNPTTGIDRVSSTTNHFATPLTNSVKSSATGGADPWPRNQYMNIWVCNMFPAILGYATFPWDAPNLDGVVLNYEYVGERPGASTAPSNLGRTCTHEAGHWLGMRHIWGDGACGIEDGIHDTPDSDGQSSQDCALTRNDCTDAGNLFWGSTNPVDMVQNFMDYSADACMTLFTRNQTQRMWHYLLTYRDSLFTSNGCGTPALNGYIISKNLTCSQSCDGEATVYPVTGTAPFKYLWNTLDGDTTATVDSLCKGTYMVRVIDADNDTIYIQTFIQTHTNIAVGTSDVVVDATCTTCADGSITINALGGTSPYMYAIDNGAPQTSNAFTGLNPGTYTIDVIDSCGSVIEYTVMVGNSAGISAYENVSAFQLYPNPASTEFTIEIKNEMSEVEMDICDLSGKQIIHQKLTGNRVTVQTKGIGKGLYFVKLLSKNTELGVFKVIIE